jgi:hypothetical protein
VDRSIRKRTRPPFLPLCVHQLIRAERGEGMRGESVRTEYLCVRMESSLLNAHHRPIVVLHNNPAGLNMRRTNMTKDMSKSSFRSRCARPFVDVKKNALERAQGQTELERPERGSPC